MKSLLHVFVGVSVGFALGVLGPVALYFLMEWADPAVRQGGGTVFAIITLLTAPAGALAGGYWSYTRLHPEPGLLKSGPLQQLNEFDEHFGKFSHEEQVQAMVQILPDWLDEYRRGMRPRFVVTILLILLSVGLPFLLFLFAGYFVRTGRLMFEMRSTLKVIRARWGDEIIEGRKPLPFTLR